MTMPPLRKLPPVRQHLEDKIAIARIQPGSVDQQDQGIASLLLKQPGNVAHVVIYVGQQRRLFSRGKSGQKHGVWVSDDTFREEPPEGKVLSSDSSKYVQLDSNDGKPSYLRKGVWMLRDPREAEAKERFEAFCRELGDFYRDGRRLRRPSEMRTDVRAVGLAQRQAVLYRDLNLVSADSRGYLRRINDYASGMKKVSLELAPMTRVPFAPGQEVQGLVTRFGNALSACAALGLDIKIPGACKEQPDVFGLIGGSLTVNFPIVGSAPGYPSRFDFKAAVDDASKRALTRGKPAGYEESQVTGYNYAMGIADGRMQDAGSWVKIYGRIIEEKAPEFQEGLLDWAREQQPAPYFQYKYYPDSLFEPKAHNKLCMYIPFEEVPRVVGYLIQKRAVFEQADFNHFLGVHLMPGVSAVVEGKGDSFDNTLWGILNSNSSIKRALLGHASTDVGEATRHEPGLLERNETKVYFAYLLRDRLVPQV